MIKHLILVLHIGILKIAFISFSILVFITRSKNSFLLKKISVGVFIISLMGVISSSCSSLINDKNQNNDEMCYKTANSQEKQFEKSDPTETETNDVRLCYLMYKN